MAYNRLLIFILITMLSMTDAPAFPADELFDTVAAAKHLEQGISYLKSKDFDAAINEFEESAGIYPEAEAYFYLGYAYYLKGRKNDGKSRQKSLENFEKAYELDPNFSPTRYKPSEPAPQLTSNPSTTEVPASPLPPVREQPKP